MPALPRSIQRALTQLIQRRFTSLAPSLGARLTALAPLAIFATLGATRVGAQTIKADSALEKCAKPVGTLAVSEPNDEMLRSFRYYQLESPTKLIRMMVQKSNCFVVVERGRALEDMRRERSLGTDDELQGGANVGKGQMKAADFVLTPTVEFMDGNAGGVGGAVGGLLGRKLGVAAGGVKFKEAQTTILIVDTRSGVQVAAAEGKAKKGSFALGGLVFAGLGVAGGGYSNTNEGKVIAASYLDNYNQIVRDVRGNAELAANSASATTGLDGRTVKAGATFVEGDVVMAKINGVKLLGLAAENGRVIATLKNTDELIVAGDEKNGFLKVQSADSEGWVKKTLVQKRK